MTFEELSTYLYDLPRVTKKNTPADSDAFYTFLGRPSEQRQIVHIAGTNGKGSTAVYLESLLKEAGYHVGLFTSPHLVSMTERMRVDGVDISEEDFILVYEAIRAALELYQKEHDYTPTFFEWMFFIAMLWYEKMGPQVIILETGLGGRLDTTNLVHQKVVTIITKISLDHTQYLGDTLEQIAVEKAGIMRPDTPTVIHAGEPLAVNTLWEWAKIMKSPAYLMPPPQDVVADSCGITFSYDFHFYGEESISLSTKAIYQAENASLALKAGEILLGKALTPSLAKKALKEAFWACRMEEIAPGVVVDGGHNPDGVEAFLKSVKNYEGERHLLFSAVEDKNFVDMLTQVVESGLFQRITLTTVGGSRAANPEDLKRAAGNSVAYEKDPLVAFQKMLREKGESTLFVAGSLYLAGTIKMYYQSMESESK